MKIRSLSKLVILLMVLPFAAFGGTGDRPSAGPTLTYSRLVQLPNGSYLIENPGLYDSYLDENGNSVIGSQTHFVVFESDPVGLCKFLGFENFISWQKSQDLPMYVSYIAIAPDGQVVFPKTMITTIVTQVICK